MPEKEEYMKRALELARKGEGHTSPESDGWLRGSQRRTDHQ